MIVSDPGELKGAPSRGARTIVIGAGAVGLYAAHELARREQDVVVVEAGGPHLSSFESDSFESVGRKHEGIRIGRNRSLGGTSNLWGGQLVEFQPIDFAGRPWLPGSAWPVTYQEIAPYYQRTYENLGIDGPSQDDARVFDHFLGSRPVFGDGLEIFLTRWLKIPSFAVSYDKEIRTSRCLRVLLDHTVMGFLGSHGTLAAVRVRDRAGIVHAIEGDHFILAAGTIEISRLLLHAAATRDWECPWRDNPNVGGYFQDHLGGRVARVQLEDRRRFFEMFSTIAWSGQKYQPKLRMTNGTLERTRIMNVHGTFAFESSVEENLVYLKQFLKAAIYSRRLTGIGDLFANLRACGKYLIPLMWKFVVDNRIFVPSISKISFVVQSEQMPLPESRIGIDPSRPDEHGLPKAVLDWRLGHEELGSIREFALRCDRALRENGLAGFDVLEDLLGLEPRFLSTLRDTNHQTGGARMSASDRDGVVNADLRVHGTKNLYVAGAATFCSSSNANTTFTALAFVTRLIDHLTAEPVTQERPAGGTHFPAGKSLC